MAITRPKPQAVKKTIARTAPVSLPQHMTARQAAKAIVAAAKAGHPNAASVTKAVATTATTGRKLINRRAKVAPSTVTAALTALALKQVLHGPTKLFVNHVPKGTSNSAQKPKAPPPRTAVSPSQARRSIAPNTSKAAPRASTPNVKTPAVVARPPIRVPARMHGDGSVDPTAFLSVPATGVDPQCDPSTPDTTTVNVGGSSDEANHWIIHASDSNMRRMAIAIAKASGDPTFSTQAFISASSDYVGPLGFENMQKGPALAMAMAAVANLQDPALTEFMQAVYGNGAKSCDVMFYAQDPTWPSWATPGCLTVAHLADLWNAGITAALDQPLPDAGASLSTALNAGVLDFGQGPGILPPGATLLPDGTCKMPDGSILRPIPAGAVQTWLNPNTGTPYAVAPSGAPVDPETGQAFAPQQAQASEQAYQPLSTDPEVAPYDPNNPNAAAYAAYARTQALAAQYAQQDPPAAASADSSSDGSSTEAPAEGAAESTEAPTDAAAGDSAPTAVSFPTDLTPAACARVVNALVNSGDSRGPRVVKALVRSARGGNPLPRAILAAVHGDTSAQATTVLRGAGLALSKAIRAAG